MAPKCCAVQADIFRIKACTVCSRHTISQLTVSSERFDQILLFDIGILVVEFALVDCGHHLDQLCIGRVSSCHKVEPVDTSPGYLWCPAIRCENREYGSTCCDEVVVSGDLRGYYLVVDGAVVDSFSLIVSLKFGVGVVVVCRFIVLDALTMIVMLIMVILIVVVFAIAFSTRDSWIR